MKRFIRTSIVAILVVLSASQASAVIRFGFKAGVALNSLKYSGVEVMDKSNRAGFTGGIMGEFTVPVVGIGVDASLLYAHRSFGSEEQISEGTNVCKSDYIDIPVNLKYKLNIPVINNIVRPFLTTGPSFSFLLGKRQVSEIFKREAVDVSWNVGFGVELIKHIQVAASYGFGINKAFSVMVPEAGGTAKIEGKNRCWTVTAAYLF